MKPKTYYIVPATEKRGLGLIDIIQAGSFQDVLESGQYSYLVEKYADKYGEIKALDEEQFTEYQQKRLDSLKTPFKEVSEEYFVEKLEELPPERWTNFEGGEFFFSPEHLSGYMTACLARNGKKYYKATKSVFAPLVGLINEILTLDGGTK